MFRGAPGTYPVDQIRLQLSLCSGTELEVTQEQVNARGHELSGGMTGMACSIIAQDISSNLMPSSGVVSHLSQPIRETYFPYQPVDGEGGLVELYGRMDSGCVDWHYHPVLTKVIV